MARMEAIYELRDQMSSKLDRMTRSASSLERRLQSLDREVKQKTADFAAWGKETTAQDKRLGAMTKTVERLETRMRRLGTVNARPSVDIRGIAEARREIAMLAAELRVLGATTARPGVGGAPLTSVSPAAMRGGNPNMVRRPSLGGGNMGGLIGAGLLAAPVAGQFLGAAGGIAGGAVGAGAVGYGIAGTGYAALGATYGIARAGFMPVQAQLARAAGARQQLTQIGRQRGMGQITAAEAARQRQQVMQGRPGEAPLSQNALAASRGFDALNKQMGQTFAEGHRGAEQFDALNRALDFAGKKGIPLLAREWDRFFPMLDKNLTKLEKWLGSTKGRSELESWMKDLPQISDNMIHMLGSAVRLGGGIVAALGPATKELTGEHGLAGWLGDKADWANSAQGMEKIQDAARAATPIIRSFGRVIGSAGSGIMDLLEGNSGRGAVYVLDTLADRTIPGLVKFMDRAATETPRFVDTLGDLASIAERVFGPGSAFEMAMTLLSGVTGALDDLTKAAGSAGPVIQAALGAGLLARFALGKGPMGAAGLGAGVGSMIGGAPGMLLGGGMGYLAMRGRGGAAAVKPGGPLINRIMGAGSKMSPWGIGAGVVGLGIQQAGGGSTFTNVLGGAVGGAGAGSIFGPWGALAGGVGGGLLGLLGGGGGAKAQAQGLPPGPLTAAEARAQIGARTFYAQPKDADRRIGQLRGDLQRDDLDPAVRAKKQHGLDMLLHPQQVAGDMGPRLQAEAARIKQETMDRARSVRELYGNYTKVTAEIEKQRKKEHDVKDLVAQRGDLARQIADVAPSAVTFGAFGGVTGVNRKAAERVQAGLQAGGPVSKRDTARRYAALRTARRTATRAGSSLVGYARGISGMRASQLEQAIASGDDQAILTIQRQLEQADPEHVAQTTDAFAAYKKTTGKSGTITEVLDSLRDFEPVFRKHLGDLKTYRSVIRDIHADAKRAREGDHRSPDAKDSGKRGKPGKNITDPDDYLEFVKSLGAGKDAKEAPKIVKSAKQTAREIAKAGADELADPKWSKAAGKSGGTITRKFADGLWSRRDIAQKNAHTVMAAVLRDEMDSKSHYDLANRIGQKITKSLADGLRTGIPDLKRAAAEVSQAGTPTGGGPGGAGDPGVDPGKWGGGATMEFAQLIAKKFGLHITSGYRSPGHNRAVGGVEGSMHTHGSAGNPGAIDEVGSTQQMNAAAAYAKSHGVPEVLVHDAGSGLHLHMGFFAAGGRVISPGALSGDRVPSMLTASEFVVTPHGEGLLERGAVRRGPGMLNRLAAMQRPAAHAGGGRAGAPPRMQRLSAEAGERFEFHFHGDINVGEGDYHETLARLVRDLRHALRNTPHRGDG